ncbi:sigma-54-dependent Fis family transcriptional regulator [Rhodoferax sp.]|uniref:sigma-54-dependent Fis family transcriptional regulator n=1 Tax=Rhodoferax sp. TaxID=50421 RepID=UPI0027263FB0|nr:sigma 54-interacting transcriptional regulator [Rhodoferax sp.]MDO9197249.1 sigma 54-interacting transcriptional regulator [Rhodoferax sp.]
MTTPQERLQAHPRILRSRGLALPPGGVPVPEILDSWGRCAEAGLPIDFVPEVPVVSSADLHRRRDQAGLLRHLALAEIEILSQQIAGSNFLLAFGDQDGVILDMFEDHRFATSSSGAGIVAGSHWAEGICGTNGLGTALAAGRAISVNGPEHYLFHFGDISCTASPIRDAWGQVVGVLDASSYFESRQRHTEALVKMATTQIENLLLCHQMRDAVVLAIHPRAEFLGTLSAGLMAFDPSGVLRAVNARAHVLLSGLSVASGTGFEELFNAPFDATVQFLRKGGTANLHDVMGSALVIRAQGAAAVASPPGYFTSPSRAAATPKAPVTAGHVSIGGQHYLAGDPCVEAALRMVAAAVRLKVPVLIHGETGTGKEQLARHAHEVSGRKGAFVAVNCGALPAELFESELFGHKGGAFTGARREDNPGLLASADGGTLLLDELRELPLALQPALLRFLDDQLVRPVGGTRSRKVDVQIVAASHTELEAEVAAGRFRADLMYRLNTVCVVLPPLRERRDFGEAVWHVLNGLAPGASITPAAIDLLASHSWPGNFRELRAVLTRALLARVDADAPLDVPELRPHVPARSGASTNGASALHVSATELVLREFERTGHNISLTSRNLAISRTTVYRHLRERRTQPQG